MGSPSINQLTAIYEGAQYPALYEDNCGTLRGHILILWGIIGEALHTKIELLKIKDGPTNNGSDYLSDEFIKNGTALTMIDGTALTNSLDWARMSAPFVFYETNIYESSGPFVEDSDLLQFSVFTYWCWTLLLLAILVFNVLQLVEKKLAPQQRSVYGWVGMGAANQLYVWFILLLIWHHGSFFKGNSIVYKPPKTTSLSDLVHTPNRILLINYLSQVSQDKLDFFSSRFVHIENMAEYRRALCENSSYFTFMFEDEAKTVCKNLNKIRISDDERHAYSEFNSTSTRKAYILLFDRTLTSRRVVKKINYVILKFSSHEMVEKWWKPRATASMKELDVATTPSTDYRPMSSAQFKIIFILFAAALGVTFLVFVLELLAPTVIKQWKGAILTVIYRKVIARVIQV